MDQTLSNFGNVFAFLALGIVFVAGGYLTARLLRPQRPNPAKTQPTNAAKKPSVVLG